MARSIPLFKWGNSLEVNNYTICLSTLFKWGNSLEVNNYTRKIAYIH